MRNGLLVACLSVAACAHPVMLGNAGDGGEVSDTDAEAMPDARDAAITPRDTGTPIEPRDADAPPDVLVFAHSDVTLFSVEPRTFAVTRIGDFMWPAGTSDREMTDIAITFDGQIWGVSRTELFRIDGNTAACTRVAALGTSLFNEYNGLSFVPQTDGTEILVGATRGGALYRIDQVTGTATQVGSYTQSAMSSGDIVSIEGAGTFATVVVDDTEYLAQIDVRNGATRLIGHGTGLVRDAARSGTWGLGYWGGTLYGFTSEGLIATIDVVTGVGTVVGMQSLSWYGAGVTTVAPIVPPV